MHANTTTTLHSIAQQIKDQYLLNKLYIAQYISFSSSSCNINLEWTNECYQMLWNVIRTGHKKKKVQGLRIYLNVGEIWIILLVDRFVSGK